MKDDEEIQLRLHALQLAMPSPPNFEQKEDIVARADAYLKFLKGE